VLRLRLALVVAVLLGGAVLVYVLSPRDEKVPAVPTPPGAKRGEAVGDPFAWTQERSGDLARRAAAGTSQVLYTRSPGGAFESAKRTARYRRPIEQAAKAAGVNPDLLEALVFLESAGRPDALAPGGIQSAAGLTQILAETATNLLGMKVDLKRSGSYTRREQHAIEDGNLRRAAALNRARRRVDDRFDPAKALAGTARYLKLARGQFGREDYAFVSYHMGIGNLQGVLSAFAAKSYAQLYFDSTPLRHAAAYNKLAAFGDDSRNYFWKLNGAAGIMRAYRADPARLEAVSGERALDETGAATLLRNAPQGGLRALAGTPRDTSLVVAPGLKLRPEAASLALYMAAQVRAIYGAPTLRITRARDGGWTFDVSRRYASHRQALAFQYALDRLQVLNVLAWARSSRAIHVTAGRDAKVLEPLLDRLSP
jgi:hypothetical protein